MEMGEVDNMAYLQLYYCNHITHAQIASVDSNMSSASHGWAEVQVQSGWLLYAAFHLICFEKIPIH